MILRFAFRSGRKLGFWRRGFERGLFGTPVTKAADARNRLVGDQLIPLGNVAGTNSRLALTNGRALRRNRTVARRHPGLMRRTIIRLTRRRVGGSS